MADTPESDLMAQKLIDALKDPVFREQLLDALAEEELDDARDAKIDAVLKSKGLEGLSEDDILRALNPVNRTPKEGDKKRETPPLFDLIWYEGKYAITSASHPQGVFEMRLADSTITMGEPATDGKKGRTYPATPVLDKASNKWWVTWGDKAQDWFSVQFLTTIPADGEDKSPLVTFKGTWHTKEDGKDAEKPFDGKWVRVTTKDTASDTVQNHKWYGAAIGGVLVLAGIGLSIRAHRRRRRQEAVERGVDPAELQADVDGRRNAQQERANQEAIEADRRARQNIRSNLIARDFYKRLPEEQFRDFEGGLAKRMKEVVDNYYEGLSQQQTAAEVEKLRNDQQGQPPEEAIGKDIKDVISERVTALVNANDVQITDSFKRFEGPFHMEGLSQEQKTMLLGEVREQAVLRAMENLAERDAAGRYGGLAGIAFDQVTKLEHAVRVKLAADQVVSNANQFINSAAAKHPVFQNLIKFAESLHEAQREQRSAVTIEERKHQVLAEVEKLEKDVTKVSKVELEAVEKHLVAQAKAMEKAKAAREAAERLGEVEAGERRSPKLLDLGRPKI